MIKRIDGSKNNSNNPFTSKVGEHIPCRYIYAMGNYGIEDNHDVYGVYDCMKKLYTEQALLYLVEKWEAMLDINGYAEAAHNENN